MCKIVSFDWKKLLFSTIVSGSAQILVPDIFFLPFTITGRTERICNARLRDVKFLKIISPELFTFHAKHENAVKYNVFFFFFF